jgi:hypothetical protein
MKKHVFAMIITLCVYISGYSMEYGGIKENEATTKKPSFLPFQKMIFKLNPTL